MEVALRRICYHAQYLVEHARHDAEELQEWSECVHNIGFGHEPDCDVAQSFRDGAWARMVKCRGNLSHLLSLVRLIYQALPEAGTLRHVRLNAKWIEDPEADWNGITDELLRIEDAAQKKLVAVEIAEEPEAKPTTEAGMSWQDAAARLDRLRLQGEAYLSRPKYAARFGCSASTIQKAINNTPILHGWSKSNTAAPSVAGLTAVALDNTAQRRESNPTDLIDDDDADAALAKLLDELPPDGRAQVNAMTQAERRALATAWASDPDVADRVWSRN